MQTETHEGLGSDQVAKFWTAPDQALFKQPTVAKVLNRSEAWCERGRWAGYGPRYIKIGRGVDYRKRDVLDWLNKYQSVNSTSECLGAAA